MAGNKAAAFIFTLTVELCCKLRRQFQLQHKLNQETTLVY